MNDVSKDIQIVFVGRYETRREKYLNAILDQGLVIYGPRWNSHGGPSFQSCLRGDEIWGEEINRLYNRAKIILNIPSWAPSYADTPNLRLVDVPAAGYARVPQLDPYREKMRYLLERCEIPYGDST